MFILLEIVLIILISFFIWSQIIYPALKNRPTFPFFRAEKKLKDTILEVNQFKHEENLKQEIKNQLKEENEHS